MSESLNIVTLEVTEFAQNCRIVVPRGCKSAVVIDPGGESERVLAALASNGWECGQIWLTHSHLDHCAGVSKLKQASGARLFAHVEEKFFRERVVEISRMYGIAPGSMEDCPEPDVELTEGAVLSLGPLRFEVLFCPGHSPGHVCFYEPSCGVLFSGDVLFAGSIGRTDLPGGDHNLLLSSIRRKLFVLPPETVVYSGHGPLTTIGHERKSNPFLAEASLE